MLKSSFYKLALATAALLTQVASSDEAAACGCLAPPIPQPEAVNFSVNQQSEQIIFEVDEGMISQHVLIRYAGAAEEFAWLLPVPSVPEITLSYSSIFGLVDSQTQPIVRQQNQNLCPRQKYQCRSHPPCAPQGPGIAFAPEDAIATSDANIASGQSASPTISAGASPPAVQVFAQEVVGDYETVVLGAGDAQLIIDWLQENQFLVSDDLAPFMQPYLDSEQLFVASKLVPGADVKAMRPLKLRYEGEVPSIPLRLTPVAAEPHLTVTAFIYANEEFEPMAQEITTIPEESFGFSKERRSNYPMALARAVDDAGGAAFVREFVGKPPVFTDDTGCCDGSFSGFSPAFARSQSAGPDGIPDACGVGNDGVCQCPSADFDAQDCSADEDAAGAILLSQQLSKKYKTLSRLTTRVSPEEMTFDPAFKGAGVMAPMRLSATATTYNLDGCEDRVAPSDDEKWTSTDELRACDAVYCGQGECVVTTLGAACDCEKGFVARSFTDLDGAPSITCVPLLPPKQAAGVPLPSPCDGKEIKHGACVEAGGFAAAVCDAGYAAGNAGPTIVGIPPSPGCLKVRARAGDPGGSNSTLALEGLRVCSPRPPMCASSGWLEERPVGGPAGVDCADNVPDASWFVEPPKPDCSPVAQMSSTMAAFQPMAKKSPEPLDTTQPKNGDGFSKGRGCSVSASPAFSYGSGIGLGGLWLLVAAAFGRRRAKVQCE